ncbi:MAG TPA: hypothetical protein VF524_09400 [Polyangia bacterium]
MVDQLASQLRVAQLVVLGYMRALRLQFLLLSDRVRQILLDLLVVAVVRSHAREQSARITFTFPGNAQGMVEPAPCRIRDHRLWWVLLHRPPVKLVLPPSFHRVLEAILLIPASSHHLDQPRH